MAPVRIVPGPTVVRVYRAGINLNLEEGEGGTNHVKTKSVPLNMTRIQKMIDNLPLMMCTRKDFASLYTIVIQTSQSMLETITTNV